MEAKKNAYFNMRLPQEELEVLKEYCDKRKRTQSDVVREFIRSLEKKL